MRLLHLLAACLVGLSLVDAEPHSRAVGLDKGQLAPRQMGMSLVSSGSIAMADVTVSPSPPPAASATPAAGPAEGNKVKDKSAPPASDAPSPAPEAGGAAPPAPADAPAPAERGNADLTVLNLAFVLETVESTFYQSAMTKFKKSDYLKAGFSPEATTIILEQIAVVQSDEAAHQKALKGDIAALGGTAFEGCQVDVSGAIKDPMTFLATARTLEAVGLSAYAGAAHLLSNPSVLTAAATILTIEARHQSLMNVFGGGSYAPQAVDIALTPSQILASAGAFLKGCQASDLGVAANNPLSVTEKKSSSTEFEVGSELELGSVMDIPEGASCQMIAGGMVAALVQPASGCKVPKGMNGPVAVYLTGSSTPLASNINEQNSADIQAGPALIFVDSEPDALGALFSASSGSKKKGHMPSANLGGYQMGKMKGVPEQIIVEKTTATTTKTTINFGPHSKGKAKSNRLGRSHERGGRMERHRRAGGGVGARDMGWGVVKA